MTRFYFDCFAFIELWKIWYVVELFQ